jgi:alkyldihydroxyacetonephosphate synthase
MDDQRQERAKLRIARTLAHLLPPEDPENQGNIQKQHCKSILLVNNEPRKKERLRWNGWGYDDSQFALNENGQLYFTGSRYELAGVELPYLRAWMENTLGLKAEETVPSQPLPKTFPPPIENKEFLKAIEGNCVRYTTDGVERLCHSHGHTAQEIYELRYGSLKRLVDCVVWPGKHEDVEAIVKAAVEHNVVIIPFGGGTSVSQALLCPEDEKRMIVSLDMHEMDKVKWVDRENMTACVEAGIVGKDLASKLEDLGFTVGHEPDSIEFSTLGGWIATRASGMKKNKYGNIEDLVVKVKMVTPLGTVERGMMCPRISSGPDINQMILGSEGIFGVITEAVIKVSKVPEVRKYGSLVFPNFEKGVHFMQEVALNKCAPASIRLLDPEQFAFGQALKVGNNGFLEAVVDKAKKLYVTKYHGFDPKQIAAATLVFEGSKAEVTQQQKKVYAIAKRFGALKGDEENGKRGYFLTFMIAYLRDLGFQHGFIAESFETSVPWSRTLELCLRVKARIKHAVKSLNIPYNPFVSCRVTQTYDVGSCVYFYFGFPFKGVSNPVAKFTEIEHAARDEILKCGGSISHHHGVGKHRKDFMERTIGPVGIDMIRGIKMRLDPKNVFANGNLIDVNPKKNQHQ